MYIYPTELRSPTFVVRYKINDVTFGPCDRNLKLIATLRTRNVSQRGIGVSAQGRRFPKTSFDFFASGFAHLIGEWGLTGEGRKRRNLTKRTQTSS